MSIEQGPNGPEKTIGEKISEFKNNFESWLNENPNVAKQLKIELLEMAGVEESELVDPEIGFDMALIKVPASELIIFGTTCGTKGNKAFSKEVVDFLQSKGVEFIIGLGENKEPIISSAAINISAEDAEKFSEMVGNNKGVLRAENSKVNRWSVFESE